MLERRLPDGLQVLDTSEEIRRLYGHGRQALDPIEYRKVGPAVLQVGELNDLEAGGFQIGLYDTAIQGMNHAGEGDLVPFLYAHRHQQGLGQGGCPVIERCVGHLHSEKPGDEGLVLVDRLEGPLAHLRLVGGVGCHEFGSAEQVGHCRRDVVLVASSPQEHLGRRRNGHGCGEGIRKIGQFPLRKGLREVRVSIPAAILRDRGVEIIQTVQAHRLQHGGDLLVCVREVTHRLGSFPQGPHGLSCIPNCIPHIDDIVNN